MKINTVNKKIKRMVISLMAAALVTSNMATATSLYAKADYQDGDNLTFETEEEYNAAVAEIPSAPDQAESNTTTSADGSSTTTQYVWTDENGSEHTLTVQSTSIDLDDSSESTEIEPASSETTDYDPWVLDHVEEDGTEVYIISETSTKDATIATTTNENRTESTTVTETVVTKDVDITEEEALALGEGNYKLTETKVDIADEATAQELKKAGVDVVEVPGETNRYEIDIKDIIADIKADKLDLTKLNLDETKAKVVITAEEAELLKNAGIDVEYNQIPGDIKEYEVSLNDILSKGIKADEVKEDSTKAKSVISKEEAEALMALGYEKYITKSQVKSGTETYKVDIDKILADEIGEGTYEIDVEAGKVVISAEKAQKLAELGYGEGYVTKTQVEDGTTNVDISIEDIIKGKVNAADVIAKENTERTITEKQAKELRKLGYTVTEKEVSDGTKLYTIDDIINGKIKASKMDKMNAMPADYVPITKEQADILAGLGYEVKSVTTTTGERVFNVSIEDILANNIDVSTLTVDENSEWVPIDAETAKALKEKGLTVKEDSTGKIYISKEEALARGEGNYTEELKLHAGIYANDGNLANVKALLGDYGVTAERIEFNNDTETNVFTDSLRVAGGGAIGTTQGNVYKYNGVDSVNTDGHVSVVQGIDRDVEKILFAHDSDAVLETDIDGSKKGQRGVNANELTVRIDGNHDGYDEQVVFAQNAKDIIISDVDLQDAKTTLDLVEDVAKLMMAEDNDVAVADRDGKKAIDATGVANKDGYDVVYAKVTVENGQLPGFNQAEGMKIIMNDDQVIVINVEAGNTDSISLYKFGIQVGGQYFTTDQVSQATSKFSQQIVFNFGSYAGNIELAGSLAGTIIAPNANVVINGTSTGQLAAKKVTNGSGEWHYSGNSAGYEKTYYYEDVNYSTQSYKGKENITTTTYSASQFVEELKKKEYSIPEYMKEQQLYKDIYESVQFKGERDTYKDQYEVSQFKGEEQLYNDEYKVGQYYGEETEKTYYYTDKKYTTDVTETMTYTLTWESQDELLITGGKTEVTYDKVTVTPTPTPTTTPTPTPEETPTPTPETTPTPTPGDNPTPTPTPVVTPTPTPEGEVLGERRLPVVTPTPDVPEGDVLGERRRPVPHTADAAQMSLWVSMLCGGIAGIATWAGLKKKEEEEA
ncbi:MAG: hypothetical protein KBS85_05700 [Lachnospiraceae bacterium]|nr:hypothetical protein [Candidatus Merdinaster equi]